MEPGDATSTGSAGNRFAWPSGWSVSVVDETGSTNDDLVRRVRGGDGAHREVVIARHQTAGRGRLDRRWEAPPGANLLMSVLTIGPSVATSSDVRRLAVAARRAVADWAVAADLKWPNDLLVDEAKLAGILAESLPFADGRRAVVSGIGLNVGWAPPGATSIAEVCSRSGLDLPSPLEVAAGVLRHWDALDATTVEAEYRAGLATIGRRVRLQMAATTLEGRAIALDDDGRLVVLDDCAVSHHIDAGDVVHLRPA